MGKKDTWKDSTVTTVPQKNLSLMILGDSGTGKTSSVTTLLGKPCKSTQDCTMRTMVLPSKFENREVKLVIWDFLHGSTTITKLPGSNWRVTINFIIFFDVTNRKSFENLDDILNKVSRLSCGSFQTYINLVANKCDLERVVTAEEMRSYFEDAVLKFKVYDLHFCGITELVATNKDSVMDFYVGIASCLLSLNPDIQDHTIVEKS